MQKHTLARHVVFAIAMLSIFYAGHPVAAQAINGAGSTFVYPAMSKWAYAYHQAKSGVTINYQSVGSGAGIAQYKAGTVDFGATDAPLSNAEMSQMPQPTLNIPVIAGAEVLAYNIPGIGPGLRLSGDVIADMFLGTIKTWNDPRIQKQNPTLKLPALAITICHRSDGSGTTYVFTDYLAVVSPEWKSKVGMGKTVNWPVGLGGRGNEGVAGLIKHSSGAVGYVELAYAAQTKLNYGPVRNQKGNYVQASIASTSAAADAAVERMKKDVRVSIVNGSGANAYPICGFVYVLISKTPKDTARAQTVIDFLKWVMGPGQAMAGELLYAPLPPSVVDLNMKALSQVRIASK